MAQAKKKSSKKAASTKPLTNEVASKPKRVLEKPTYKAFRLHKRIKYSDVPLIGSFRLTKANFVHLFRHKKTFLLILAVYAVLSFILVTGLLGTTNFTELKDSMHQLFTRNSQLATGFTLFGVLFSSGVGSTTGSGGVYQSILLVLMSLVFIWTLRQTYAGVKVTVRNAFYKSMYPLIPFILVFVVIGLQFLPLAAGSALYGIVMSQGLAVTSIEKFLWSLLLLCIVLLTLYMLSSSIFALYIVTLPDMTPMKALRSARELVRYRRWSIMRKILFLPLSLLVIAAIIMIPILLYLTPVAQLIFVLLSMIGLLVFHGYMYRLYRELL